MNDIFEEMRKMREHMNSMFKEFFAEPQHRLASSADEGKGKGNVPSVMKEPLTNVVEKGSNLVATFEMPGVEKKDIRLNVGEDHIEVKAEKKTEKKVEKKGMYRYESFYKGYHRVVPLPRPVKADSAKASYENGILTVTVPKAKEAVKRKEVKVE